MSRGKFVYVKAKKLAPYDNAHWSEKKKLDALALFASTGSATLVSNQLGVPYKTIETWRRTDWWKEGIAGIRNSENDVLDAKLTKALDKALDSVMDRIDNGEYIYDQKTGKIKRAPAKLRDVNHALNSIIDKRQLIRKLPTRITESSTSEAQLRQLAQQFAEFTKKITPPEKIVEYIDGDTVTQNDDGTYAVKE